MSLLVSTPVAAPSPGLLGKTGELVSFTLQTQPGESISVLCQRLAARLRETGSIPLHLLVFGKLDVHIPFRDTLRKLFGRVDWPITWVEGAACQGGLIAGIHVHAFTGEADRITYGGRVIGSVFTGGGARQCFVGGLMPVEKTLPCAEQTRLVLEDLQAVFALAGFELADTVRTWFFLDNILSWYDGFNQARSKIYSGIKFRTGSLPASTGVGAKNSAGAALALAAWAFRPLDRNAFAEEVASPLQCPAPAYGSSFSRAMEVSTNSRRRLFVSGTASIAPGGKTLWTGDVRRQVDLTMEVVEAVLRSRGFTLADLTHATAYFRNPTDAAIYTEWLRVNQLSGMPVISAQCDVCRDDLLFELEAEAESNIC